MSNIGMLSTGLIVAATATLPSVAVAHADDYDYKVLEFGDSAKNIACTLRYQAPIDSAGPLQPGDHRGFLNTVSCSVLKVTFVRPESGPCPGDMGYTFSLSATEPAAMECMYPESTIATVYSTLEPGQSHTAGSIICSGEAAGIKCTNDATGQYFLASRDSYQLG